MSETKDYKFTKKSRRMTSPPQNESLWFIGYKGVETKMETDPERIAYFAREASFGDIMREPTEGELADTLAEVAGGKVLGAAYKGGIGFRIKASRVTMDQMLRLAEGAGGAGSGAGAQTTRDCDMRAFNIIVPNTINALKERTVRKADETPELEELRYRRIDLHGRVIDHVRETRKLYADLVDAGVPPQDARYVALPLGFQTQWFHIMSLGNLIKLCEQRMCNGLMQPETNFLVRCIRDLVVAAYPWIDKQLRSHCEKRGECTRGTLLFPPCGAFVGELEMGVSEEEYRLAVTQYDPERHLYPSEQNDGMRFAMWDAMRIALEEKYPDTIFCMSRPPYPIYKTEG